MTALKHLGGSLNNLSHYYNNQNNCTSHQTLNVERDFLLSQNVLKCHPKLTIFTRVENGFKYFSSSLLNLFLLDFFSET